jgi:hypothetical protein
MFFLSHLLSSQFPQVLYDVIAEGVVLLHGLNLSNASIQIIESERRPFNWRPVTL